MVLNRERDREIEKREQRKIGKEFEEVRKNWKEEERKEKENDD